MFLSFQVLFSGKTTNLLNAKTKKIRRVPIEPLLFPLAHGIPNRSHVFKGIGNSIVPQLGAVFIKTFTEALEE